jgi:hypothetical protein
MKIQGFIYMEENSSFMLSDGGIFQISSEILGRFMIIYGVIHLIG